MPFGAVAAGVASAAVGAGISALSSKGQSGNVSSNAGAVQNRLMALQPQIQNAYDTTTAAYQPYTAAGGQGLTATTDLLGLNGPDAATAAMANYQTSPGYQWQLGEGLRAVDAGAAAKGMLRSGATLKAEQTFGQGLANTDFGNYWNRLAALSEQGLTAAGGIASANQNYIANLSGNAGAMNTASTGATNAQDSILGNTASGLSNTANSLFSNPNVQNYVGGLFSDGVSNSTVANNALYQQQQFAAQPAGTFGPFV